MTQVLTLSRPSRGSSRAAARLRLRAAALWRAYPRETMGFGLLGLVAAAGDRAVRRIPRPELPAGANAPAPPAPPPMLIRQLAPEQALQVNRGDPGRVGPNPAARPFVFKGNR